MRLALREFQVFAAFGVHPLHHVLHDADVVLAKVRLSLPQDRQHVPLRGCAGLVRHRLGADRGSPLGQTGVYIVGTTL